MGDEDNYIEISSGSDDGNYDGRSCYADHYGSTWDEIVEYLDSVGLGDHIRMLDVTNMRPLPTPPTEATVYFTNSRGRHFMALGIDPVDGVYAEIGARNVERHFRRWLRRSHIDLGRDVSPVVGAQQESECGAYIAIFAEWFLTERLPAQRPRRAIRDFRRRVSELMAQWRDNRRNG